MPDQPKIPMRAASFLDTLGVCSHLDSGPYGDAARQDRMLDYIGISNVRLNAPVTDKGEADMISLARNGAKVDFLINGYGPVSLTNTMANLREYLPYIDVIELPNEVDIFPITYAGLSGIDAAMKFQQDVYAAVRADHSFDDIPIYGFTLGSSPTSSFPSLRDMSPYADYANVHAYAPNGIRPAWVLPAAIEGWRKIAPSDPVVVTETGYYTSPGHTGWGGVTENVQAQYILDTAFGNASRGVARTYFYDLINDGPDINERENNFGLFRFDGSAKPVANALHNLTTILADTGPSAATFATHTASYSLSGLPFTASSMLLEKSSGAHIIAVWNEEDLWNETTGTEIASKHYTATVTFDRVYDTVLVFDPTRGTDAITTLRNVSSVQLDVASHPLLVQLGAAAAPAPVTPPPVTPVPVTPVPESSTGTDTLVLRLSEDAFQGHAQYVVKVDGAQVGGVRTASASHAAGQTETVTLTGNWAGATHKVLVEFTNDLFTPGVGDRNLYLHDVSFNGVRQPDSGAIFYGPGAKSVSFGGDTLTVRVSEDHWGANAQFAVTVDGVLVGGVNTVTASHAAKQTQDFTFSGNWGAGNHKVGVNFLNDAWGGTAATDRNLVVEGISFNGQAVTSGPVTLLSNGIREFGFGGDSIALRISEDAYQGHAQYTVKVDGVQVGGVRTASASHAAGQTEAVTLTGSWGTGAHKVTVDFLNDAYQPGVGDRNLYVDAIVLNGKVMPGTGAVLYGAGARDFALGEKALTLRISEDAYQGDAQFTVKVDGVQVGGVNTAIASHSAGKSQDFTFKGSWGAGHHDVAVEFINDLFTPGVGDRNLYVEAISVDGAAQPGLGAILYGPAPAHFDLLLGG